MLALNLRSGYTIIRAAVRLCSSKSGADRQRGVEGSRYHAPVQAPMALRKRPHCLDGFTGCGCERDGVRVNSILPSIIEH